MNLGEKIFKLRKEKGFSQEVLAEKLGTTRQAVSKWENNQGFPETEKLMQLSNIFEVSVDFLLKDEKTIKNTDEKGFYVNREMAEGYLMSEKRCANILELHLCAGHWLEYHLYYFMRIPHGVIWEWPFASLSEFLLRCSECLSNRNNIKF